MRSSRLPGKVLADVNGRPALTRLLRRLRRTQTIHDIVLATTTDPADDVLEAWARDEGVACYRGSEEDVLRRVVEAQRLMNGEVVVEVTGDCTLLDPEITDMGVRTFLANDCDVVTNNGRPSYPMGVDVMVFRLADLEEVERVVHDPAVREHVSLHFVEAPDRYRVLHLIAPTRWHGPERRFQLDYPEDLHFINEVYRRLEPEYGDGFGIEEIMALLRREPALAAINQGCEEKPVR